MKTISDSISDTRLSIANYHSRGLVKNALTAGLVSGSISVMTIKYTELLELLESYSPSEINETTKELLSLIKRHVIESNAQLVSHTSSKIVIAWNTMIS